MKKIELKKSLIFLIIGIVAVIVALNWFFKTDTNQVIGIIGMGIAGVELITYIVLKYIMKSKKYNLIKKVVVVDGKEIRFRELSPENQAYASAIYENFIISIMHVVNFVSVAIVLALKTSILKFVLFAIGVVIIMVYLTTKDIKVKSFFNKILSLSIFQNLVIQIILMFISFLSIYLDYNIISWILWSILIYNTAGSAYLSAKQLIFEAQNLSFQNLK